MAPTGGLLARFAPPADNRYRHDTISRSGARASSHRRRASPPRQGPSGYTVKQVVIENPILNSPFAEPCRHFRFGEEGITNEIVPARRSSSYFIPIPAAKKKRKSQLVLDTE